MLLPSMVSTYRSVTLLDTTEGLNSMFGVYGKLEYIFFLVVSKNFGLNLCMNLMYIFTDQNFCSLRGKVI